MKMVRYVNVFFPDEIPLEKTHQIEKEVKERFNAEIVEGDDYITIFEVEESQLEEIKNYAESQGCQADIVECKICGKPAERVLRTSRNIDYYCKECYDSLP